MHPLRLSLIVATLALSASWTPAAVSQHEVTTTANAAAGSLRQAIFDANADPDESRIVFNIPGPGPHFIQPTVQLPNLNPNTTIDATDHLDANGEPTIILDGRLAPTAEAGIGMPNANCAVEGLSILFWKSRGVAIIGPGSCAVRSCRIEASPETAVGISIISSPNNIIGGTEPGQGNLITGNSIGISITDSGSTGNQVMGNRIGTDRSGMHSVPNGVGIQLNLAGGSNVIGGSEPGAGNLISGNETDGISILEANATTIQGNLIGLAADGLTPLANDIGVRLTNSSQTTIGGSTPRARNVISGNEVFVQGSSSSAGLRIEGATSIGNRIIGNRIGTDVTGMIAVPNLRGIDVRAGSATVIGSEVSGEGNLISGNTHGGIDIGSATHAVRGNVIGLAADGLTPLPNGIKGIAIGFMGRAIIGGNLPGQGNVISGNDGPGVVILGATNLHNTGSKVFGNFIGTDATGQHFIPNEHGVFLSFADNCEIGGNDPSLGNVISGNLSKGVFLAGSFDNLIQNNRIEFTADNPQFLGLECSGIEVQSGLRNRFVSNSVFGSGGLGIDLLGTGVTDNDDSDIDTGPNDFQNFPIITQASMEATPPRCRGFLNSAPGNYTLEFFLSESGDPSGHGEGQHPLGTIPLTLNRRFAVGPIASQEFLVSFATPLPAGRYLTATATDATGNTSEFSPWFLAPDRDPTTEEIISFLLGLGADPGDLDLDSSGAVDAADLVSSVLSKQRVSESRLHPTVRE